MVNHGCQVCAQPGGTLFRFYPPPGCTKPAVVVCYGCAHQYSGLYDYLCKTDAKQEFKLSDGELDGLRCAYTKNPHYGGFAQRMLYLRDDLQEASSAKYAAEGGLAGHLALKAQRKAQRLAASDERKSKRAQRRRRLRDCLEAMHGISADMKYAALETERAQRYFTYGHADLEAVAHEALVQAVFATGAAPASPPAAQQSASSVKPEVATPLPMVAAKRLQPLMPSKRPREAVPEDVASLRAKRLAALAARGVETGIVAHHSGSGAAGDEIVVD